MKDWLKNIDRTNAFVALGVWLVSLIVYVRTMAPTVTFWDCGEFIAVSYILGIPHPPGTPLYVLVGKLFTWNPFIGDPSARINFLSALSSSFTAMFAYLCGVRIMRHWFTDLKDTYTRIILYAGAAAGALFLAWGKTQWNNSTEAEVYGLSMVMFLAVVWLTLKHFDSEDTAAQDKYMLAAVYIAFLGIGVHMTTFLVLPICMLFFVFKKDTPLKYWFMASVLIALELYLIFALSSRPKEVPFYLPVFVVFIIYLMYVMSIPKVHRILMFIAGGFAIASIPVAGGVINLVNSAGNAQKSTPEAWPLLNALGIAGFVVLVFLGIWAWVEHRRSAGKTEESRPLIVGAGFVAVAAVMALLLVVGVRGYTAFLALSVILIGAMGVLLWQYIRWPVFIAIVGSSLVILGVYQFAWGLLGAALALVALGFMFKVPGWRVGLVTLAVAVAGFSVHLFIPIRSAQDPYINENNPSQSLAQTVNFIERKQYGSQSMTERMFKRRAEWENQFGTWRRMGYWGFFADQYGINGRTFAVALVLGVFGLWEAVRRRSQVGLLLTLLIIISSIGLVLYMNFADGVRQHPVTGEDYIEVRDRDYFFTPAYVLFGLAIGLGITALVQFVRESTANFSAGPRKVILGALLVLFLLPSFALARNYWECDRSNNWIAHDYATNHLNSADRNAAFFTYGDNDTFPLWCLQEAYRYRKDVRVVNLSLANTKWYIKQVQNYMGLDLGMTEKQIDDMRPYRTQDGRTFQLSNQVVDAVIQHNRRTVPINFSTTVATDGRKYEGRSADPYLTLTGLAFRMRDDGGGYQVAVDEAMRFYMDDERFKVRGLTDSTIYKDANQLRLTGNYSNGFRMTADSLRRAERIDDATRLLEYGVRVLPYNEDMVTYLANLYAAAGRDNDVDRLLQDPRMTDQRLVTVLRARALRGARKYVEAEAALNQVFLNNPTYAPAFDELTQLYNETENWQSLNTTFDIWLQANPKDNQVRSLKTELEQYLTSRRQPAPVTQ